MGDDDVRDRRQPLRGVVVPVGDRLVGEVAAGHDEDPGPAGGRGAEGVEEQVVQRRVGEHETQEAVAGRDRGGHRAPAAAVRAAPEQHDRAAVALQQRRLVRADLADRPDRCQVGCHEGERLVLPDLASTEGGDGLLVAGVAGEVIATEALEGDDAPGVQEPGAAPDRLGAAPGTFPRPLQPHAGAADRAGDRLGVEPPVGGVLVLLPAVPTHGEGRHRGVGTVVGDVPGDGVARAAVGAVGEGVAGSPGARLADLGQALVAGADVRRDQGEPAGTRGLAGHDGEAVPAGGLERLVRDALDASERGGRPDQVPQERLDGGRRPFHLDGHPGGIVAHVPAEGQPRGEVVHEGPEPHPLHDALHEHPPAAVRNGHGPTLRRERE